MASRSSLMLDPPRPISFPTSILPIWKTNSAFRLGLPVPCPRPRGPSLGLDPWRSRTWPLPTLLKGLGGREALTEVNLCPVNSTGAASSSQSSSAIFKKLGKFNRVAARGFSLLKQQTEPCWMLRNKRCWEQQVRRRQKSSTSQQSGFFSVKAKDLF